MQERLKEDQRRVDQLNTERFTKITGEKKREINERKEQRKALKTKRCIPTRNQEEGSVELNEQEVCRTEEHSMMTCGQKSAMVKESVEEGIY